MTPELRINNIATQETNCGNSLHQTIKIGHTVKLERHAINYENAAEKKELEMNDLYFAVWVIDR